MRVIGYIEHPRLKITVFKMDSRITVQIENALYTQSYKLNQDLVHGLKEVEQILTPAAFDEIEKHFTTMHLIMAKALSTLGTTSLDTWDEVI